MTAAEICKRATEGIILAAGLLAVTLVDFEEQWGALSVQKGLGRAVLMYTQRE